MENKDLKYIKKHYGEEMMHLCREMFPKILEKEGVLFEILKTHFSENHRIGKDIKKNFKEDEFKSYVYSYYDVDKNNSKVETQKSAEELLSEVGYKLYPECKTEAELQSFKKWYYHGEELCSFFGNRLDICRVWFAVKNNAEELKREKFPDPKRQDEYGTSVISIQFTKSEHQTLSIKNRYNHSVENPDNTFDNDLDNINLGLTDAFERDFGVRDMVFGEPELQLDDYVCIRGKHYHFNKKINNIYYCDKNSAIKDFEVVTLPNHQMFVDYFVVDFKEKTIKVFDENIDDCFPETIGKIKSINFKEGVLKFSVENGLDVEICLDENNDIVSYKNENVKKCGDNFYQKGKHLKVLSMPNLEECGNNFLHDCKTEFEYDLSNLKICKDNFCFSNNKNKIINFEKMQSCGENFFVSNCVIEKVNMPSLVCCGQLFIFNCGKLKELKMPSLERCGDDFAGANVEMEKLHLPSLQICGDDFLFSNTKLKKLNLPFLETCGYGFLMSNEVIEKVNFPFVNMNDDLKRLVKIAKRNSKVNTKKQANSLNLEGEEKCNR